MFKFKSAAALLFAALLFAALPPALAQDELPESPPADAPTQPSVTDREVLEALYAVTGGDNWTVNSNWLSDMPLDQWHGVTTDTDGRVTKLMLSANELAGPIPAELGALVNLAFLELGNNQLTGPIPVELGNLANLEVLWLNQNLLSGPIPAELGALANLESLQLYDNELSGPIPVDLGNLPNLAFLDIGGNSGLCAPTEAAFQAWFQSVVINDSVPNCASTDRIQPPDTPEAITSRDRLIADQENLLNTYRCMFDIDTLIVRGGCIDGRPAQPAAEPDPFAGTPNANEIYVRESLIASQESLLNIYRCRFDIDTEVVPGGCANGQPVEPDQIQ